MNDELKEKLCEIYHQRKEAFRISRLDIDVIFDGLKQELALLSDNQLVQSESTFTNLLMGIYAIKRCLWASKNVKGIEKAIETEMMLLKSRENINPNKSIDYRLDCWGSS